MQPVEHLSTLTLTPTQRLPIWNEIAAQVFPGTNVLSDDPVFAAEMWHWRLGDLTLMRPLTPRGHVHRQASTTPTSHLVLHIQHRGQTRYKQRGHIAELGSGDMNLNCTHEPYHVELSAGNELLCVEFPAQPLLERVPALQDTVGCRLPGYATAVQLLHHYVLSLWQSGNNAVMEQPWRDDAIQAFYHLVAATLRPSESTHNQPTLLRRLQAAIASRLTDPELDTAALAREVCVSARSVQSAFATSHTTPSAYITHARLTLAAQWLRIYPKRPVTDIAFAVGFNDSAYFSRCFRRRFGMSPSLWRDG